MRFFVFIFHLAEILQRGNSSFFIIFLTPVFWAPKIIENRIILPLENFRRHRFSSSMQTAQRERIEHLWSSAHVYLHINPPMSRHLIAEMMRIAGEFAIDVPAEVRAKLCTHCGTLFESDGSSVRTVAHPSKVFPIFLLFLLCCTFSTC